MSHLTRVAFSSCFFASACCIAIDAFALAASTSQAICKTYDTWKECFKPLYALDRQLKGLVGVDLTIETSGKVTSASLVPRSVFAAKDEAAVAFGHGLAGSSVDEKKTITAGTVDQVVQRIVRANFPRFRACYESGVAKDPALKGNISVQFVIDSTGSMESAVLAGGSITHKYVTNCVVGIFRTLSFPEPEGGKVTVTFPIEFSMGVPATK